MNSQKAPLPKSYQGLETEYDNQILFDYILTAFYSGDPEDFKVRLSNLKISLSTLPKNIHVILIEQLTEHSTTYVDSLPLSDYLPKITVIKVDKDKSSCFNKAWLYNKAAKSAITNHLLFADMDILHRPLYFHDMHTWLEEKDALGAKIYYMLCFNIAHYLNRFMTNSRAHEPYPGGLEGTLNYFDRDFFFSIGGFNEFIKAVAFLDNQIASIARHASKSDIKYPEEIYHLWHDRLNCTWGYVDKNEQQLILRKPEIYLKAQQLFSNEIGSEDGPLGEKYGYNLLMAQKRKSLGKI